MRRFLETLAEQTERHDGGNRWVGTGGRSPYGNNGTHPTGIRVGGESRSRSAMKVAEERRFEDYRTDGTLDIRQTRVALRRLRQLTRTGPQSELDLDETIDETCKNAGEIELVFRPERRNDLRLLLLMDGGTMNPFFGPSASCGAPPAGPAHFRPTTSTASTKARGNARLLRREAIPTGDLLRSSLALEGDRQRRGVHPAELMEANGNIDPRRGTATRGIDWLKRIKDHFERVVWLNPEPAEEWSRYQTVKLVQRIFPMFHLSVDGIHEAVSALVGARATH
jgi:uncharacterized protein with von Willebrand factor type A (vWA) domain